MILKIYCYKDPKIGAFTNPIFKAEDPDVAAALLTRVLKAAKPEELKSIAGYDFYYLGTFDDETGEMCPAKTLLLSDIGGIE